MPRLAATLALLITLLMGLVIGQIRALGVSTTPPQPAVVQTEPSFDDALRYYRAVNKLLLTGDSFDLRDTLASGFIDHSNLRAEPGDGVALERELTLLRGLGSGIQLNVSEVVSQHGIVAVRVGMTNRSREDDIDLRMTAGANSANYELLRIVDGKVAERWASSSLPGVVQPVSSLEVPQGAGTPREARLERLAFSPSAEISIGTHWGTMLFIESGSVQLRMNRSVDAETVPGDAVRTATYAEMLVTGMVRPIAAAMPFQLRNFSDRPAKLLWLTIRDIGAGMSSEARDDDTDSGTDASVRISVVAAGATIRPQVGACTFTARQVELAAGTVLTLERAPEAAILFVEAGEIGVNPRSGLALRVTESGAIGPVDGQLFLHPGEAVASVSSSDLEYQVEGNLPATALLFTVAPVAESI